MKRVRWAAGRLLRRFGYELHSLEGQDQFNRAELVDAVKPYTLTTRDRIRVLADAVEYVSTNKIEGSLVECGVWKGGSMMAVALTLLERGADDRDLWLYDTFDGMVEPTQYDVDSQGRSMRELWVDANPRTTGSDMTRSPRTEVETNMASTGYPVGRIRYVEGKVEDTIPGEAPEKIALLRLDTDWYESYAHVLTHLVPRVVGGGIVIFDDYVEFEGARRAVDEWVASWPEPLFLMRVGAARLVVI